MDKVLKFKEIGDTGLRVSDICFGTAPLAGMPETFGYDVDEERAAETISAILDSGVNFIDTSNNYGDGRAEERLGRVFAARGGLPEGMVLSTKLDRDPKTGRFDADRARASLEESLTRLGLDRVHLLHLHDPEWARDLDEITVMGGALDTLFAMKDEGLCDATGLAMGRLDLMGELLDHGPFDAIISHNRMTLLNRSADALFDRAEARGIAILNAAPYASGALAKGADAGRVAYQKPSGTERERIAAIEAACARHGVPMGAAALDFSRSDPRVTSTIVGISKPGRVAETLDWAATHIPDALRAELAVIDHATDDPEAGRDLRAT